MATNMSDTQTVAAIVEMLGGMKINPDALLANDIPEAQAIMSAIAEQLWVGGRLKSDASSNAMMSLRAAFKDIALEGEELQVFKKLGTCQSDQSPELSGYRLPSEIKREAEHIRFEVQALEEETERLKARSQQMKKASKRMSCNVRTLQDTFSVVRSTNEKTVKRIDDLSSQVDGTITDAAQAGCTLLSSFENAPYDGYVTALNSIDQAYSNYADTLTSYLDYLDSSSRTLVEETGVDADELESLLKRYSPDAKWEDIPLSVREYQIQQAYLAQLGDLCDKMEGISVSQESNRDWIVDAMYLVEAEGAEESDIPEDCMPNVVPNVRAEIDYALAKDQLAYLNSRNVVLDNAISVMEHTIMTPLDDLLSHLSLEEKLVREAEVLCGVLDEEIESTVEAVTSSQLASESPQDSTVADPVEGEGAINDPSAESLKGLEGWEREVEARERQFGPGHDGLSHVLGPLNTSHDHFLHAIYANSPLNTSPPFAYSPHSMTLMNEARTVTTRLNDEIDRLTEEVENSIESRRAQRKLGTFVDRWINT